MADIFIFIQQGWKNIWKQNVIWLFSALTLSNLLPRVAPNMRASNLLLSFLSLTEAIISLILFYVGYIGVSYPAYCFSIGKSVTIRETLFAIKKFYGRVIGCSCLILLIFSPFLCLAAVIIKKSTDPAPILNNVILATLAFSSFSAIWEFTMFGFFANDLGIRQSLCEAWALFTNHFGVLAILGVVLPLIFRIYYAASGILTVTIQSGFDVTSLSKLNYIIPSTSLSNNILFLLISTIGTIIFSPFSASVFTLAYLKYSEVKIPASVMQ